MNTEEIKNAIAAFRKEHKCKRVFLSDDDCFAQKYYSFRLAALERFGGDESGDILPLKDEVLWSKDDKPKPVEICKADVIAIFDNTKIGFFGNISNCECEYGALITTKGIVTLNAHAEGFPDTSGFVSWRAFIVGNQSGIEYCEGANVYLYTDSEENDCYPKGPETAFHFWQSKLRDLDLYPLFRKMRSILKESNKTTEV